MSDPKTPAQRQVEAQEDIERIARALYETIWTEPGRWAVLSDQPRETWRTYARSLVLQGVIRPGRRPPEPEAPIPGQTTIEEQLDA